MYSDAKKDLRARLNEADDIYNPVEDIDDNYVLPRALVKGDNVILRNLGTEGVLLEDPDNDEELEFFLRLQRERFTWTGVLKNCVEIKVGNQDITCDYFWENQRILYFSNDQGLTPEIIESIKVAGYFVFIANEMHKRFNEFRALF